MFSWVTQQLETISQAVAPPPEDPPGLFLHCCTRGDEAGAMEAAYRFDATGYGGDLGLVVVHPGRRQTALHVACQFGLARVAEYLLSGSQSRGGDRTHVLEARDGAGNTALHAAAAATGSPEAVLHLVQRLVTEFQASPVAKNEQGQTPYDVATLDRVRQYLLPIQLQQETQAALDNGGVGLPPGVDLGGHRINYANSTLGPPPMVPGMGAAGPPPMMGMPSNTMTAPPAVVTVPNEQQELQDATASVFDTPMAAHKVPVSEFSTEPGPQPPFPSDSQPPVNPGAAGSSVAAPPTHAAPPSSGNSQGSSGPAASSGYATRGYSSAHIYNPKGRRVLLPDGFHSSSSDKKLQEKYGHQTPPTSAGLTNMPPPPPPPPTSAGLIGGGVAPGVEGARNPVSAATAANPFAGGHSVFASGSARVGLQRYVPVDPMTGRALPVPQPQAPTQQPPPYAAVPFAASQHETRASLFIPGATPAQQQQTFPAAPGPAPPAAPVQALSAAPAAAAVSAAPSSGGVFPPPPKRSDVVSPRAQSMSSFPSPPAPVSFPTPPRATSSGTSLSPPSTAPSGSTAVIFPAPPMSSGRFAAAPAPSPVSNASSLFAAPPTPTARTVSSHDRSEPETTAHGTSTMASAQSPSVKESMALPDQQQASSEQVRPTTTMPSTQSAAVLFSSPAKEEASDVAGSSPAAIPNLEALSVQDVQPSHTITSQGSTLVQSDMARSKSSDSVMSASELFSSMPPAAAAAEPASTEAYREEMHPNTHPNNLSVENGPATSESPTKHDDESETLQEVPL